MALLPATVFTLATFVATVLTLAIEPPTKFTLATLVATVPILVLAVATVVIFAFAKLYSLTLGELCAQFPEYERQLLGPMGYDQDLNGLIEIIRYYDKDQSVVYVPRRDNLVLSKAKNPINKLMIVVAKRPNVDDDIRGQFDD